MVVAAAHDLDSRGTALLRHGPTLVYRRTATQSRFPAHLFPRTQPGTLRHQPLHARAAVVVLPPHPAACAHALVGDRPARVSGGSSTVGGGVAGTARQAPLHRP